MWLDIPFREKERDKLPFREPENAFALEGGQPRHKSHAESTEGQIKLSDDLPSALMKLKLDMEGEKELIAQVLMQARAHARTTGQTRNTVPETLAPV